MQIDGRIALDDLRLADGGRRRVDDPTARAPIGCTESWPPRSQSVRRTEGAVAKTAKRAKAAKAAAKDQQGDRPAPTKVAPRRRGRKTSATTEAAVIDGYAGGDGVGRVLVIVESPAKAKTIGKYLGRGYRVKATVGHVRDLPEKKLGIDIDERLRAGVRDDRRQGEDARRAQDRGARTRDEIFIATDPDREGEAIALARRRADQAQRGGAPIRRVLFHEITKDAVQRAIASAGRDRRARRSMRSRRAACSTGSWATRRARSSGRRSRRASPRVACRRSRSG